VPTLTRRDIDDAAIEWVKAALAEVDGLNSATQEMIEAAEQDMFTLLFSDRLGVANAT
jgi:hypothetical protein